MPQLSGIALGHELKSRGAEIPIVYVTGYHQDFGKYRPNELPLCGAFLLKPFAPETLAKAIRKIIAPASIAP